jgi:hypothetical protein
MEDNADALSALRTVREQARSYSPVKFRRAFGWSELAREPHSATLPDKRMLRPCPTANPPHAETPIADLVRDWLNATARTPPEQAGRRPITWPCR